MTWQIDPRAHASGVFRPTLRHDDGAWPLHRGRHLRQIDPENPVQSSIEVTINGSSLTTNNAQRDNDLRSSHFLELDKYPIITFRGTRIEPTGAGPVRFDW